MEQAIDEITWKGVLDELWPLLDKLSVKAYLMHVCSSWDAFDVTDEKLTLDGESSSDDVLNTFHNTETRLGAVGLIIISFAKELVNDQMSHFRSEDGNSEYGKILLLPSERIVRINWTISHVAEQEAPTKSFDFTPPIMMRVADALGQDGET